MAESRWDSRRGMGQHATFGFTEGKRRSPDLGRFRMGELVRAHLRPSHPRPFAVPRPQRQRRCAPRPSHGPGANGIMTPSGLAPQRQRRCGIQPGVAPPRRYPGFRPQRVPYPARGCAVRARRGRDIKGRNGIVFAGAEEEPARNVCLISTKYTHLTYNPFEPSAQPRWGCLCLWPLPGVAPLQALPRVQAAARSLPRKGLCRSCPREVL